MYAVEFETVADGKTIHIPDEYAEFESRNVKVILMMNPRNKNKSQEKTKPGTAKGKIFISDDFEQPLDEETIKQFYQ